MGNSQNTLKDVHLQALSPKARTHSFVLLLLAVSLCALLSAQADPAFSQPDTTTAADAVVTFNEIMYHPVGDDQGLQWIELYNQMSIDIELSNWQIEGAIDYRFPTNTILRANRHIVIAANPTALRAATGLKNLYGPFSKQLQSAGGTLRLRNLNGRIMDELTFSNEYPWPIAADGSGASLAKRERYSASSPAANWRASLQVGGTPGQPNFSESQSTARATDLAATPASLAIEQANLIFSEVASADSPAFFIEVRNRGLTSQALAGCSIISSSGQRFTFGAQTLGSGEFLALGTNELSFSVGSGAKLFLIGSSQNILDGVRVGNRLLGRSSTRTDRWLYPTVPTPGASNQFHLHDEIVINEIMYHHPPAYTIVTNRPVMSKNNEQWIELYNRSTNAVELTGWRLEDAVRFTFPSNTVLAPDAYLVIAKNASALRAQYPDITVLGNFSGKLSHRGGHLLLSDEQGNPANEVTYYPDFPWPAHTDGGGSSLELRDPHSDNSVPESWAASIESAKSSWHHYSYRARAINPVFAPDLYSFHEFRMGLLSEGEALLDNVSVLELPTNSAPRQLLQNTNFTSGTAKWRLVGNHAHSRAEANPDAPADPVLHLIATGPMTYLENQIESTLKAGGALVPVVAGREYEISFDAKWLAGSPQLHTELYYNKIAATTVLDRPTRLGTPGRRNSTWTANAGPTYTGLQHSPVVPTSTNNLTVTVHSSDPNGVLGLKLHYALRGSAWRELPMSPLSAQPDGYTAIIPAQSDGAIIQFYVQGTDRLGATSTYPAEGTNSRALIQVDNTPRLVANQQTFRTILTPADANLLHYFVNLMSDDLMSCTVIHNEREVFYDARIRLHGSMYSRANASTTGFTVKFPRDHLFRGSRPSVVVRRSNLVETIAKHILNQAGGLPANYGDVVRLVSHRPDNLGAATLTLANYDNTYVDSQFEHNRDGTLFKLEGIRVFESTDNGTPEGYKLPHPISFVWDYDLTDLGDDPEQYRWSILIQNQRARDDFSPVIALGKAFHRTGTALRQAVPNVIDLDEWARYFALQSLLGITDIYGNGSAHNVAFYVRPDDGRILVLQNDWGFVCGNPPTASIDGQHKIYEILALPGYRRLYQGHLLDLINSVFNGAYLTRWAKHFSAVAGTSFNYIPAYADQRAAYVRSQLPAAVPFAITSNRGADFAVSTPTVTLEGRGWINVHHIRLAESAIPLLITWLDDQRWQLTLPLKAGTNRLRLVACDYRGTQVGQAAITVTSTISALLNPSPSRARPASAP